MLDLFKPVWSSGIRAIASRDAWIERWASRFEFGNRVTEKEAKESERKKERVHIDQRSDYNVKDRLRAKSKRNILGTIFAREEFRIIKNLQASHTTVCGFFVVQYAKYSPGFSANLEGADGVSCCVSDLPSVTSLSRHWCALNDIDI